MALQCIVLILVMISFQGNNLATILDGVVEVGPSGIHAILSSVDHGAAHCPCAQAWMVSPFRNTGIAEISSINTEGQPPIPMFHSHVYHFHVS